MSLGKKSGMGGTESLWVAYHEVPQGPSHPFYSRLEKILRKHEFDSFCEKLYAPYYAEAMGRPSILTGVYFRLLMIGYFEGIGSERGIAWKVADSKSLEEFLDYRLFEGTRDHSSLSRIRHRLPLEAHKEVFAKVVEILQEEGLLRGRKIGVDASNLEANAAMRSIRRRIDGKWYTAYLRKLAKESGREETSQEELARFDRNRPDKSCSNQDWENPNDPDSKVTKMKDGRTHSACKAEHALDLESGVVVSAVVRPADTGESETIWDTVTEAAENLQMVQEAVESEGQILEKLVADKGDHSNAVPDPCLCVRPLLVMRKMYRGGVYSAPNRTVIPI